MNMSPTTLITYMAIAGLVLFTILALAGCSKSEPEVRYDWWGNVISEDQPPREFKEKCELAKAFRLYKDHEGKWACKLDDGRVWTETD